MKNSKLIPVLAVLFALVVLVVTIYMHTTMPEGPVSTFTPPEAEQSSDAPAAPWGAGVEIVTPIA